MKPSHLFSKELNERDGAYYRRWAAAIGPNTAILIDRVLKSYRHEEQGYRSCAGMLHMCKSTPKSVVEEAAQKCIAAKACKYSYFKAMLGKSSTYKQANETSQDQSLPNHENIRGKGFYR